MTTNLTGRALAVLALGLVTSSQPVVAAAASDSGALDIEYATLRAPALQQGYYVTASPSLVLLQQRIKALGGWQDLATGFGVTLAGGEYLLPWGGLGFFLEMGSAQNEATSTFLGGAGFDLRALPWRTLTVRTQFGLGFAQVNPKPSGGTEGGFGSYLGLGVGYDFFPWQTKGSGGWAIAPALQARVNLGDDGYTAVVGWLGLDLTWTSGLPRNQLILPPDEAYRP